MKYVQREYVQECKTKKKMLTLTGGCLLILLLALLYKLHGKNNFTDCLQNKDFPTFHEFGGIFLMFKLEREI